MKRICAGVGFGCSGRARGGAEARDVRFRARAMLRRIAGRRLFFRQKGVSCLRGVSLKRERTEEHEEHAE